MNFQAYKLLSPQQTPEEEAIKRILDRVKNRDHLSKSSKRAEARLMNRSKNANEHLRNKSRNADEHIEFGSHPIVITAPSAPSVGRCQPPRRLNRREQLVNLEQENLFMVNRMAKIMRHRKPQSEVSLRTVRPLKQYPERKSDDLKRIAQENIRLLKALYEPGEVNAREIHKAEFKHHQEIMEKLQKFESAWNDRRIARKAHRLIRKSVSLHIKEWGGMPSPRHSQPIVFVNNPFLPYLHSHAHGHAHSHTHSHTHN